MNERLTKAEERLLTRLRWKQPIALLIAVSFLLFGGFWTIWGLRVLKAEPVTKQYTAWRYLNPHLADGFVRLEARFNQTNPTTELEKSLLKDLRSLTSTLSSIMMSSLLLIVGVSAYLAGMLFLAIWSERRRFLRMISKLRS